MCAQWLSRVQLCDPMDYGLPGSSVHGISQARVLQWAAISSSRGPSRPGERARVSHAGWGRRYCCAAGGAQEAHGITAVKINLHTHQPRYIVVNRAQIQCSGSN